MLGLQSHSSFSLLLFAGVGVVVESRKNISKVLNYSWTIWNPKLPANAEMVSTFFCVVSNLFLLWNWRIYIVAFGGWSMAIFSLCSNYLSVLQDTNSCYYSWASRQSFVCFKAACRRGVWVIAMKIELFASFVSKPLITEIAAILSLKSGVRLQRNNIVRVATSS